MKIATLLKTDDFAIQKELISKIRDFINAKNLEPGDRIPAERLLSEKFGVSRANLRVALQKLEFYGLLQSIPQSGTYITDVGMIATNGIIKDILRLEDPNFKSLVETRILLELEMVRLAAIHRTNEDLEDMNNALQAYKTKILNVDSAVQEDLLFHLAIAKASGNSSMNSIMLMITPEIVLNFKKYHICDVDSSRSVIDEHDAIFDAIKNQDSILVQEKMKEHFNLLYQYCNNFQ